MSILDKLYTDFETDAKEPYDPNFTVRLCGYMEPGGKVKQVEKISEMPLCKELVGWGGYEFFVCKSQNYPIQKFYNQKIPWHLYNENKKWSLGSALEHIGKLNHKFLRSQWEKLGFKWHDVPMQYLKPYNKLDTLAMDWLDTWIQGKYSSKQNNLLQAVNQCLCELTWKGIVIDLEENKKQYIEYKNITEKSHQELLKIADINWNSPEQVGNVLKKSGAKLRRTKSGKQWAVNKEALKEFKDHPLVKQYLEWNHERTLLDTFIIGIHDKIQLDGRLHPNFSFATTGRYRCSRPNMQNLPKPDKGPMRRQIIPESPGGILYAVDWDQLEICLIAVVYKLEKLLEEIKSGIDVHQKAADRFNIERHAAKQCNFATFYGATKWALGKHGFEPDAAQQFINYIHSEYPDLRKVHSEIDELIKKGTITNIFDRTRRTFKFTDAINFLIQSVAGDLNKMMLIKANELGSAYQSRPYFDVHDELVFTVCKEEENEYLTKVILPCYNHINEEIERWFGFRFPIDLQSTIKKGPNYGQLEEYHAYKSCR